MAIYVLGAQRVTEFITETHVCTYGLLEFKWQLIYTESRCISENGVYGYIGHTSLEAWHVV